MGRINGPTRVTDSYLSCGLCRYHDQRLIHSGQRPLYWHYCTHPDSQPASSLRITIFLEERGRRIGENDRTPAWCPLKPENRRGEPTC